tara:strand:- start:1965 stop:2747 length:783 start_codon:yes stop_codon:yes gene_type:complete
MNNVYHNMPFPEYQAIDALNSGKVRNAIKSLRYMRRKELEVVPDYNYTFEFGKAFAYICESEQVFNAHVAVGPTKTPIAKAWQEQLAEDPNIVLLTESDFHACKAMYEAVKELHPECLQEDVLRELTFTWDCELTDTLMKGRCDLLVPIAKDVYHLIDVKTISDIYKFGWQVRDFKYDVQLAMYADGLRHNGYQIHKVSNLFIEKQANLPEVYMHTYNDEQLSQAWDRYIYAVKAINFSRKDGVYPGFKPEVTKNDLVGL